jgi:hypothetical protein
MYADISQLFPFRKNGITAVTVYSLIIGLFPLLEGNDSKGDLPS